MGTGRCRELTNGTQPACADARRLMFANHSRLPLFSVFSTHCPADDVDAALADLDETFDKGRDDLDRLFESVRRYSARRRGSGDT